MDYFKYIVGGVFGSAIGLYLGYLLTAIIVHWESTATTTKAYRSMIMFVLGGMGGAAISWLFCGASAVFYVLGLAVGMIFAFFYCQRFPSPFTFNSVKLIIQMSEAMRDSIPDVDQRTILIIAPLAPAKAIEHKEKISEKEWTQKLEEATDGFKDESTEIVEEGLD